MLKKTGERQVGTTLEEIRDDHKQRYEWAVSRLNRPTLVVDAGCGVGYGSQMLSKASIKVFAVDVSTDAINFARAHWQQSNIHFATQDLHFFELEGAPTCDAIVAFEVIEHLINPALFLVHAKRALAPEGRIFISVPNQDRLPHTVEMNPFHMRHFSYAEIAALLESCGFRIVACVSQTDSELIDASTNGDFLIIEAGLQQDAETPFSLDEMYKEAICNASSLINLRAITTKKNSNRVRKLEAQIQEINPAQLSADLKQAQTALAAADNAASDLSAKVLALSAHNTSLVNANQKLCSQLTAIRPLDQAFLELYKSLRKALGIPVKRRKARSKN